MYFLLQYEYCSRLLVSSPSRLLVSSSPCLLARFVSRLLVSSSPRLLARSVSLRLARFRSSSRTLVLFSLLYTIAESSQLSQEPILPRSSQIGVSTDRVYLCFYISVQSLEVIQAIGKSCLSPRYRYYSEVSLNSEEKAYCYRYQRQ